MTRVNDREWNIERLSGSATVGLINIADNTECSAVYYASLPELNDDLR